MPFYVYVLKSLKDNKLYIGCTGDLLKRIVAHNKGAVASTKGRLPLNLIYSEEYQDKYEAFYKERYYKSAKGKRELLSKLV